MLLIDFYLTGQNLAQKKLPAYRWIALSSEGFAAETRLALEEAGVSCLTYAELLRELVPLDQYNEHLISEYETWVTENWRGEDWYIRPHLLTDITYEKRPALNHFAKWFGDSRSNFLVVLGDLGTGKSTLARFLAYNLAKSFASDPLRHPAPVLIPLKEVRKENPKHLQSQRAGAAALAAGDDCQIPAQAHRGTNHQRRQSLHGLHQHLGGARGAKRPHSGQADQAATDAGADLALMARREGHDPLPRACALCGEIDHGEGDGILPGKIFVSVGNPEVL